MKEVSLSTWAAFSSVVAVAACGGEAAHATAEQLGVSEGAAVATRRPKLALEIDGTDAGWIMSVEGGRATSEVVTEKIGGDALAKKKHIANVKYDDLAVKVPLPIPQGVANWVSEFVAGQAPRRSGSIKACDANLAACDALEFTSAMLTEVGFPACDGSSKDAAYLTLKFSPEITRNT